ncbi:MAG TPA: hypothetical protein VM901_09660 [Bdellovibrionota bacterium]|jgi:hypothetical protein|nr:hypothetical protein [Bdellovibrionota bacterium]
MNKVIATLSLGLLVACASKEPPAEINPDLLHPAPATAVTESAKPAKSLGKDYTAESLKRVQAERKVPKPAELPKRPDLEDLDRPNRQ